MAMNTIKSAHNQSLQARQKGASLFGAPELRVRRHDCQALPPSTCTLDHHGQASLSMFMYLGEHVVIGPVNHVYAWRATAEKLCPTMVLRPSHPAQNRGSRKEVAGWEWFAEPPNNKLANHQNPCQQPLIITAFLSQKKAKCGYGATWTLPSSCHSYRPPAYSSADLIYFKTLSKARIPKPTSHIDQKSTRTCQKIKEKA
jgi:hypothetical protein